MNLKRITRYFNKHPKALFGYSIIFSFTIHALLLMHVTSAKFSNQTNQPGKIAKVCISMENVSIHRKEKNIMKKQIKVSEKRETELFQEKSIKKQEFEIKEFEENTSEDETYQEESSQPLSASGKTVDKKITDYMNEIYKKIYEAKRYPVQAKRMNQKGIVRVKFILKKNGTLKGDVYIIKKCNYEALNDAAINTIIKANPYPPFPSELKKDDISFSIDLNFCL